jgi:hypothetical protein
MGGVYYLYGLRSFADPPRDDLGAARGAGLASLAGLATWIVVFAIWKFLF